MAPSDSDFEAKFTMESERGGVVDEPPFRILVVGDFSGNAEKRAVKARLFQELKDEYQVLKGNWGGYAGYDRFFEQPLSNAHLASIATYEDFVPAFRALLQREGSFPKFYNAVKRLADMDRADRHRILNGMAPPLVTSPLMVQRSEMRP